MKFTAPKLPYQLDALAPIISKAQLELHYEGHLIGYVKKLNQIPIIAESSMVKLEEIILMGKHEHYDNRSDVLPPGNRPSAIYNLSAQIYNHTFFFKCLSPKGGGDPSGDFAAIVKNQYGSWEKFKKKIISKGNNLFGSGWIWVVIDDEGELLILKGLNAETPLVYRGLTPVMCIDIWEHSYYLDYENRRNEYLNAVIDNLINWDFVNRNLANIK